MHKRSILKYHNYIIPVVSLFLSSINFVPADKLGALFLSIPPGAKALSMGMAFTASLNNPTVVYYNPGALGLYDRFGLVVVNQGLPPGIGRFIEQRLLASSGAIFYHSVIKPEPPWLEELHSDMRYIYGSYVLPISKIGTFGISSTYLNTGTTDVIDESGVYLGSYEPYDRAIGLSYGRSILGRIGIGITAKYIYSFLIPRWVIDSMPELGIEEGGDARAYAIDIGSLYSIRGIGVGGSLTNFGTRMKFYPTDSFARLPMRIRVGVSIQPFVLLDSLMFLNNIKVFDMSINQVINVVINYDRAYDPKDPDDTWISTGWEFTLLRFVSYRRGSCPRFIPGTTTGFGLNLRNIEIDVGKYFFWDTYHVQLTMHSLATPANLRNNKKTNSWLTLASSALAPGGGQFYKGEGIKGSLFFIPALFASNYCLTAESNNTKTVAYIGLGLLYLSSTLEAMLTK